MRGRWGVILFGIGWLGALALALRAGAIAFGVTPEHLIALTVTSYMGVWGLVFFVSRGDRAGDAARFVTCSASILVALALVEAPGALGLVDYRSLFSTPTPPWRRPGYRPDPELIYVREGNRRVRWKVQGAELHKLWGAPPGRAYHCDIQLDGNGFRNSPALASADVAVIGDSFIEGALVAEAQVLTSHLSRLTGLSVANLGRSGYGPQQELAVLRRYALSRRPRRCVWAFYEGNDLQDVDAYESYQRELHWILRGRRAETIYGRGCVRNALAFAIRTWLRPDPRREARLFTGRFTDHGGKQLPMCFATGVQHGDGGPELPRARAPQLEKVRVILAEAHALCRQRGIELVVVFIPSKFRVYRHACAFDPDSPCLSWPIDDLPEALRSAVAAVSTGLPYVDLTPRLQAEASGGALLYLPDDPHWTAEGHRAAAEVLAEYFSESKCARSTF
jgi:hypothetical protein